MQGVSWLRERVCSCGQRHSILRHSKLVGCCSATPNKREAQKICRELAVEIQDLFDSLSAERRSRRCGRDDFPKGSFKQFRARRRTGSWCNCKNYDQNSSSTDHVLSDTRNKPTREAGSVWMNAQTASLHGMAPQ